MYSNYRGFSHSQMFFLVHTFYFYVEQQTRPLNHIMKLMLASNQLVLHRVDSAELTKGSGSQRLVKQCADRQSNNCFDWVKRTNSREQLLSHHYSSPTHLEWIEYSHGPLNHPSAPLPCYLLIVAPLNFHYRFYFLPTLSWTRFFEHTIFLLLIFK